MLAMFWLIQFSQKLSGFLVFFFWDKIHPHKSLREKLFSWTSTEMAEERSPWTSWSPYSVIKKIYKAHSVSLKSTLCNWIKLWPSGLSKCFKNVLQSHHYTSILSVPWPGIPYLPVPVAHQKTFFKNMYNSPILKICINSLKRCIIWPTHALEP